MTKDDILRRERCLIKIRELLTYCETEKNGNIQKTSRI